jgi:hypothetical protein
MDEAGYSYDWKSDIDTQPFYVASAVCVPSPSYPEACKTVRKEIDSLKLPGADKPIGQGFEIKARDIAQGKGWWRDHEKERNQVRNLMLSFPTVYDGTAFVVVVDKKKHWAHYANPADPSLLSFQFLFERLQWYLSEIDDHSVCIYDQNKRMEDALHGFSATLMREGVDIIHNIWGIHTLEINRIVEFTLGKSQNSIGLQVADFFSTLTNFYYKDGKPSPRGWWDTLVSSLYKKGGKLVGCGLKEFP